MMSSNSYSGHSTPKLRSMETVENFCLAENHTFKEKDTLYLRIAEEANLQGITMKVLCSDNFNLVVTGVNFYVRSTYNEKHGWKVHTAICCEGDDVNTIPASDKMTPNEGVMMRAPFKSKWFAPLIESAIQNNPSATTKI